MLPPDHPPIPAPKTGVLLLNLGTPDGTDFFSVRRYLAEFLSDIRVIDAPRWFWLPLLHGIILTTRPKRSGHAYAQIWNRERNESPLKTHMRALAERVRATIGRDDVVVEWAMRYGNPSTQSGIDALLAQGCRRIVALAMYPQYSATTTASAYDKVFQVLQNPKLKWQPRLTTLGPYHDHPLYIEALADSVRNTIYGGASRRPRTPPHCVVADAPEENTPLDGTPETPRAFPQSEGGEAPARGANLHLPPSVSDSELHIIASFHGLPQRYFREGDPYHCHCQKTSRLLREALGWPEDRWHTAFQSRFGPAKWLMPYTSDTVARLAAEGKKHIAMISPGFAADCIETLEELNIGLREAFLAAGGESFTYIPCLNDSDAHVALVQALVEKAL